MIINLLWLVLSAFVYGLATYELKLPLAIGGAAVAVFLFSLSSQFERVNPRSAVPLGRFADFFCSATVRALLPFLLVIASYVAGLAFRWEPNTSLIAGVALGFVAWLALLPGPILQVAGRLIRGRAKPVALAESKATIERPTDDPGILWGGILIPSKYATSHFMVVGTTGSGKTITIRLLMQDVLPSIGVKADHRALIYDAKQDVAAQLAGMGLECPVYTLNPFDKRCVAWDMSADIREPATALQLADTLIPQDAQASQPFFVNAAQSILYGVLLAFIKAGGQWRLSDVLRAMQSVAHLEVILKQYRETLPIYERFFENRDTLANIMSTVGIKTIPYEPIAAMWENSEELASDPLSTDPAESRRVSLTQWIAPKDGKNFILILGNSEKARKALDAINRVIFKTLTELILDYPENEDDSRRVWVFLDEIAEAGELDGLTSLLAKGRSKGAAVVLGYQDIQALQTVYGREQANTLAGLCNNRAILRLESPETCSWASHLFGSYEAIEVKRSESFTSGSQGSHSVSYAEDFAHRSAVLESEFSLIPVTSSKNGLGGYYIVPDLGAYYHTYEGQWLFGEQTRALAPTAKDVPNIDRRDPASDYGNQFLRGWTDSDFKRLNMPHLAKIPLPAGEAAKKAMKGKIPESHGGLEP